MNIRFSMNRIAWTPVSVEITTKESQTRRELYEFLESREKREIKLSLNLVT